MTPSPLSHNGIFSVLSTRTNEHRTFRVLTQPAGSEFTPGSRVLSLLVGPCPDSEDSWQPFAFVSTRGVHVWKRLRGARGIPSQFDRFASMLERLEKHEAAGRVTVHAETSCRRCNRPLTTPESVREGCGPVCRLKEATGAAVDVDADAKDDGQAENAEPRYVPPASYSPWTLDDASEANCRPAGS